MGPWNEPVYPFHHDKELNHLLGNLSLVSVVFLSVTLI